jgi:hypothetical protein
MDFAEHADLTGRLRGLVILLDDRLTLDQARSAEEVIDAAEFGVALELLADTLSEQKTPIPDDLRVEFERLSARLGDADRVMGPLAVCPVEAT